MSDNKLLFKNTFLNPRVNTASSADEYNKKKNEFRKYYTTKHAGIVGAPDVVNDTLVPEHYNPHDLISTNSIHGITTSGEQTLQQDTEEDRFFRSRTTLVNIDSRDRDQAVYANPNAYTISLNRKFINVKQITMRSSEFPNSEQLIMDTPVSKQNNKIIWQDEGDTNIYIATIAPGNYQPSSLQSAIQTAMNSIKKPSGDYHNFTVSIDSVSDICSFSSLSKVQLANPFSTVAGTSIITVNHPGHGYPSGTYINISGTASFAGINASLVNTNHVITYLTTDSYTIDITDTIIQTTDAQGGSSVQIGIGNNFSLLFSEQGTPADILGFPLENTHYAYVQQNTTIAVQYDIEQVKHIDTIYTAVTVNATGRDIVLGSTFTIDSTSLPAGKRVYIEQVIGTSANGLINDPTGYIISQLSALDASSIGLTADQKTRTIKIPANINIGSIGSGGTMSLRTLNKPVKLAGQNFIYMTSPQLNSMGNSGTVKNIFAKIDFSAPPGSILFNTHIAGPMKYTSTLNELSELTFAFVDYSGVPFDFLNAEHSFTLEVKELIHEVSSGVGYNSSTGHRDTT
jgi:hypothetical protein